MKKQSLHNAFVCLLLIGFIFTAAAQTADEMQLQKEETKNLISGEASVELLSAYIWRGLVLTENPVYQPNVNLGVNLKEYGRLFTDIAANVNTTTRPGHTHCGGIDEIEYVVGYEYEIRSLKLAIAHTWWTYPSITDSAYEASTREINLNAEYANDYVVPFIEVVADYGRADGFYGLAGLRKEVQVVDQLTVGAEVTLGAGTNPYTEYYFDNNSKSGLVDGNLAIYSQFDITDHIFLSARIAYTAVLDSDIQGVYPEYDNYPKDHMLWGGITFGVTF